MSHTLRASIPVEIFCEVVRTVGVFSLFGSLLNVVPLGRQYRLSHTTEARGVALFHLVDQITNDSGMKLRFAEHNRFLLLVCLF